MYNYIALHFNNLYKELGMKKKSNKLSKKTDILKEKFFDFSSETLDIANEINNLCEITYDYCANNAKDGITSNLLTIIEIIKNKNAKLINKIDSDMIKLYNI